tara:strand:+ start:559 stop:744 length:186 start_codon:yes stop_codon:yes gene_type:complete
MNVSGNYSAYNAGRRGVQARITNDEAITNLEKLAKNEDKTLSPKEQRKISLDMLNSLKLYA